MPQSRRRTIRRIVRKPVASWMVLAALIAPHPRALAEGEWEITAESEATLNRGLQWLKQNQGADGNWGSNDLGLVSMGALAFLSAGHMPGRGEYGETVEKALNYVVSKAQPSGLLNIADAQRDMYNHGLSAFVLGQAHGMSSDSRVGETLSRGLRLITATQCKDGGWDYRARSLDRGHDLSLAVMQAKALRSAVDSGLEVPPDVIQRAIKSVREHYHSQAGQNASEEEQRARPGQFTYGRGGSQPTIAMAAAGVVCLQEFGQYDDWRIEKNMDLISTAVKKEAERAERRSGGRMAFDGYTTYYVGQALYQVGGEHWRECFPLLRDQLVASQIDQPQDLGQHGAWQSDPRVGGKPGQLYSTSVACFILAMPNRYLPILQEGKIEGLKGQFSSEK